MIRIIPLVVRTRFSLFSSYVCLPKCFCLSEKGEKMEMFMKVLISF